MSSRLTAAVVIAFSALAVFHVMRYINVRYLLTYLLTHFYSLIVCWAVQRRLFCSYFLCCINLKLLCELWSWNSDENVHFLALPPPSVSQSVCLSVCLSVCQSVYMKLSVCTSVCLSPINSLVYHYMSYIFIISVMPAGSVCVSAHNSFTLTVCWEVPLSHELPSQQS